jgi:hypothetical protein
VAQSSDGLEIKGLGLAVQNVRRSISLIRAEVAGLHDDAWKLQKALVDLRDNINKTRDDLKFEAENLGNGPEQGELQQQGAAAHSPIGERPLQPDHQSDVGPTPVPPNGPLPVESLPETFVRAATRPLTAVSTDMKPSFDDVEAKARAYRATNHGKP